MNLYLSPAQGAKELIFKLDQGLETLATMLRHNAENIRIDALYEIPLRNSPTVDKAEPIHVRSLTDQEAVDLTIEVLTSIWLRSAQSPKETLRAPGAIAVPDLMLEQINATNKLRMELFEIIKPLDQQARIDIWRAHPAIASLQALRVTPLLSKPFTLRFYWDTGASIERKRVMDLIQVYDELLLKNHGYRPSLQSLAEESGDRKLVFAIDMLERLMPDEQVAIYRPVTPHIRARVRDGEEPGYICSAPIPFVYSQSSAPPRIKPLLDYKPVLTPGKRSIRAQLMDEPYIDSMNIYRYMEMYRKFGPVDSKDRTRNKRKNII
ncbi:DNA replication terminus site-binding protein [Azomonas macrocytogenes]|uniref:DNA replication terminus site-binding protein n=1 Tax=Azomonas macrocytogenes TaxID=69962 RepID=A0A839T5G6_AZOMA|nr:DNA replication terminus site-binding protein [Azomonas macrocytogenes]MBB3104767.1 hypothetical protein [Azomonas macrocytogenes]